MTKRELLNGVTFEFDNSEYQESICSDDIRGADVYYNKSYPHQEDNSHLWVI